MLVEETDVQGVLLFTPRAYSDERGFFSQIYDATHRKAIGDAVFVQEMHSRSLRGVLRGLHFRRARPQGQLVTIMRGEAFDAVVDLRRSSPTFGRWTAVRLKDDGVRQIYMPPGCAHGFLALSDWCDLHYKVTEFYDGADAKTVRWDDPKIGVDWPLDGLEPTLSPKDAAAPPLSELDPDALPAVTSAQLNRPTETR